MNTRRVSVISANSLDLEEPYDGGDARTDPSIPGDIAAQLEARRKARPKRVLLEPVIALYFAAWVPSVALIQQYIYWRVARDMNLTQDAGHTEVEQRACSGVNLTSTQESILVSVQDDVADWLVYLDLSGDIPGLFMVMFLGSYANVIGKKFALMLPPLGGLVTCITYMVHALFNLPIPVLFIGSVVEALTGGYTGMLLASLFYMEDTLDRGQDPAIFALSDISYGIVLGVAEVGMGYFMKYTGFVIPLATLLGINVINLVYIAKFVPDIDSSKIDGFQPACCSCSPFYKRREGYLRRVLGVGLLALVLFSMVYSSKPGLITLYQLNTPFCWDSVKIGHFRGIAYASSQVAQTVFTVFLIRPLTGEGVFTISCLSLVAMFLWMSFMTTDWSMYVAPLLGCVGAVSSPLIITILYNMVPPNEQDELLADIFVLDIACNILGATVFNPLYGATQTVFKGTAFLVMAGFVSLCILLIIIFAVLKRKHKRFVEENEHRMDYVGEGAKEEGEGGGVGEGGMTQLEYMVFSQRL